MPKWRIFNVAYSTNILSLPSLFVDTCVFPGTLSADPFSLPALNELPDEDLLHEFVRRRLLAMELMLELKRFKRDQI